MSQVHVITDRSGRALGCVGIVFGTMFGGFGLVFVAAVVGASIGHPNPLLIFPIGFGGLFALGGGAGVYFGVRSVWHRHLWGVPTLTLPSREPLYLGEVIVARFQRVGGSRRPEQPVRLSADLVGEERARYKQGTDHHTVTQEIGRHPLAVRSDEFPGAVSGQVVIEVPVDVAPSLSLHDNEIVWSVKVRVQVPGTRDDTGTFVVTIRPALAPDRSSRRDGSGYGGTGYAGPGESR